MPFCDFRAFSVGGSCVPNCHRQFIKRHNLGQILSLIWSTAVVNEVHKFVVDHTILLTAQTTPHLHHELSD